jgi:peptidoglycan/LPS O-acetylase OafA/YrhL
MNEKESRAPRRRPGRLWLFFWGRKRRGFPGLLVAIVVIVLVLAGLYGVPGGVDLSRWWYALSFIALVLLILGSIVLALLGLFRPPRGRR